MNNSQQKSTAGPSALLAAPVLSAVSPAQGPVSGGNTVTLTGSGFVGATAVRFGAANAASYTVVSATQISAVVPAGAAGPVAVTVTSPSGTSNGVTYTYVAAPVLSVVSPAQGPASGGNTVTLTGSGFVGVTAVKFGAVNAVSYTVVSATQITAVVPAGAAGSVAVTVTTSSGTSNGVTYTYVAAPTLLAISPAQGTTSGGNMVTLTGTGFLGANAVKFDAVDAVSYTVVSATQITAVAPAGAAGPVAVTVTTAGGTSNGVTYTYTAPAPVISAVSPAQGPVSGGNTVTLTGSGFLGANAVKFGAVDAASYTVVSSTQITAVAPAGAAGPVAVTVTTSSGTSNSVTYTYVAAPVISAVSPAQGPAAGGNTVTITGSGFVGAAAVKFDAVDAVSYTVVSATQITAVAPAGAAGAVSVTVTTAGGTSNGVTYTYAAAPVLSAVSPAQGPVSGGNTVTLTGNGFLGATAVKFGAANASSYTVIDATQITAIVPPGAGAVQVTVTTAGGTSNSVPYAYVAGPVVTALSPSQGPTADGNTVTVSGANLTWTQAVQFGAAPAAFTVVSDTLLATTAPAGPPGPVNVTVTTPGGTSAPLVYTRVAPPGI